MFNLKPRGKPSAGDRPSQRAVASSIKDSPTESAPPAESSAYAFDTLGAILRERREAMGVSLAEAETATRIRPKYLSAIEADDWHLLPGEIVGRGFLRNYAIYLGLEPNELIERRRAATDPSLAATLRNTSAGTALPPERQVDYRPKALDLKDEPEGIDERSRNLTPALAILLVLAVAFFGWWLMNRFGEQSGEIIASLQTRVAVAVQPAEATAVSIDVPLAGEGGGDNATPQGVEAQPDASAAPVAAPVASPVLPTDTPTEAPAAVPTDTPPLPTDTPPPTPTETLPPPTDTPLPAPPTNTPTPEPPPVVAPLCPDPRAVITSPGMNQVVGGVVDIIGTATHESFQFYKLEFAPGSVDGLADVAWNWFAGSNTGSVQGGRLGQLDTRGLANGVYTIRVVVVDLSANFPPPCAVSIVVQN